MAGTAVTVDVAGRFRIGFIAFAGIGLVLVIVMAEVLGGGPRLMLAIDANCRPAELEGQKNHQENGEQAKHLEIIPEASGMHGYRLQKPAGNPKPAIHRSNASGSLGRTAEVDHPAGIGRGAVIQIRDRLSARRPQRSLTYWHVSGGNVPGTCRSAQGHVDRWLFIV